MSHDDALDALIASAKAHDVPPEGAEDHAWTALAAGLGGGGGGGGGADGGAGLPAGSEAATATTASGGAAVIKAVAGVALAAATAAGVATWVAPEPDVSTRPEPAPAQLVPARTEPAPARSAPAVAEVPVPELSEAVVALTDGAGLSDADEPDLVVLDPEPPARPPRGRKSAALSRPAAPQSPPSASSLADEARLIGSMWTALDRGDPRRALVLAKSHKERFEDGALRLEARGAALAARCALGHRIKPRELEAVKNAATRAVVKRISSACAKKP